MFNRTSNQVKKEILKNRDIKHIGFRCYDKQGRICDAGREEMNRKQSLKYMSMMIELEYNEVEIAKISETYVVVKYKVT